MVPPSESHCPIETTAQRDRNYSVRDNRPMLCSVRTLPLLKATQKYRKDKDNRFNHFSYKKTRVWDGFSNGTWTYLDPEDHGAHKLTL